MPHCCIDIFFKIGEISTGQGKILDRILKYISQFHLVSDLKILVKKGDENSQPFSIRKICQLTPKWRKAIFKSLIKGLKSQNINRNLFMLNSYLKLSLNFIQT